MISRWPSVCLSVPASVRSPYVRTSFSFDNLSIYKRISLKFAYAFVSRISRLGLFMGKFR